VQSVVVPERVLSSAVATPMLSELSDGVIIAGKGMRMEQQRHREAAMDIVLYALPVYLPFYQALLMGGIARAMLLLLLAVLLMFLVRYSVDLYRSIALCRRTLPSQWLAPAPCLGFRQLSFASLAVPSAPSLSPLFQRPPPIFS
jgi:hypothetical protein